MSSITEQQIRQALTARAAAVPDAAVTRIKSKRYRVQTVSARRVATTAVASIAITAGVGVALTRGHPPAVPPQTRLQAVPPPTRLRAVPVVYVGNSPPLAVRSLPKGFHLRTGEAKQTILGQASTKSVPEKQFVEGPANDPTSIVVAEGTDGEGPTPKVQGYAAANPRLTTKTVINGTTVTVIQVGFGDLASYVAFFPVSDISWGIVAGTQGATPDQLLTIAAGILRGTS